jgi:hypothetical protein
MWGAVIAPCNTGFGAGCAATVQSVNSGQLSPDGNWWTAVNAAGTPSAVFAQAYVTTNGAFPVGDGSPGSELWAPNNSTSQWITWGANQGALYAPSFQIGRSYYFATTFTIETVQDLATAFLSGRWASDNRGMAIWLNGVQINQTSTPGPWSFTGTWANFTIGSGSPFRVGSNTLVFELVNGSPDLVYDWGYTPVGVRVEFDQQQASVVPTPEPGSLVLLGLALLALARLISSRAAWRARLAWLPYLRK